MRRCLPRFFQNFILALGLAHPGADCLLVPLQNPGELCSDEVLVRLPGHGQDLPLLKPLHHAEDGHSLELTIDRYIQYRVEQGLEDMVARFGAKNGATGIVMDVNTGGLLAIASSPTYDLMDHHAIYDWRPWL